MVDPLRTLVVWCPDWPVVAAIRDADGRPGSRPDGRDAVPSDHVPVAVLVAGRVHACSELARAAGVRRGQRRRDAQAHCPELVVVAHDPARDVRVFEPVVDAVDAVAPGVEVIAPGVCALAARGPSRYFGGEAAAAELIVDRVAEHCEVEAQVGVADGMLAAQLAARTGVLVEPGRTTEFLAGLDVRVLGRPELVGLLRRLGIRTLGAFAALPAGDVLARFGFDAAIAHRLAGGGEQRGLAPRTVPPDLAVGEEFDPPLERVDAAAFGARALAERLHERLLRNGVAGTRLLIEATTATGEVRRRTWRHDGVLSATDVADRVRWQLEGWLTGTDRPTGGIGRLRLSPDGIVAHADLQPELWGTANGRPVDRDAAYRSAARVQGLLGPEAVLTPVLGGGRSPSDLVRFTPWGDDRVPAHPGTPARESTLPLPDLAAPTTPDVPARSAVPPAPAGRAGARRAADPPWPGQLPVPGPAAVSPDPVGARVLAADGSPVGVTGRNAVTAPPATVAVDGGPPVEVLGWAGPWPVDERWWLATTNPAGAPALPGAPGRPGVPDRPGASGPAGASDRTGTPGQSGAPARPGAADRTGTLGEAVVSSRGARRLARIQVSLPGGRGLLLAVAGGRWWVEASYD